MNQTALMNRNSIIAPRKIFRAYDIRGHIDLLNATLIQQIGLALAIQFRQFNQTTVVLGYDARLTSESYADLITQALASSGMDVIQIGCVSTPLLYFAAQQYAGNGIMITASHNPVSDNGIKWLLNGLPPSPEQIQQIADLIEQQQYIHGSGAIQKKNYFSEYFQYLQRDIKLQPASICIDGLHGSAGAIACQVLEKFGMKLHALNCYADGHFPLGAPDPSDPRRLVDLKQSVIQNKAIMGIALDGDGDRLVILDEYGQYVSPDRLISLFAKLCLIQQNNAEIVCDVKCSTMIAQTVADYGGRFTMIRTGSSFLRTYLSQHQACFGGEFAGHYVFNDGRGKGFDDGLYAALRILEYLTTTGQSLTQVLAEFPERVATQDIYIASQGMEYSKISQHIEQQRFSNEIVLSKVDGIRLDFPFGFGIIRPSNTGEYFTVRFDADQQQHLQQIRQTFVDLLQNNFPEIAQTMATAS